MDGMLDSRVVGAALAVDPVGLRLPAVVPVGAREPPPLGVTPEADGVHGRPIGWLGVMPNPSGAEVNGY